MLCTQWRLYVYIGKSYVEVDGVRSNIIRRASDGQNEVWKAYQEGQAIRKRMEAQGKRARKRLSIMLVAPEDPGRHALIEGKFILDLKSKGCPSSRVKETY